MNRSVKIACVVAVMVTAIFSGYIFGKNDFFRLTATKGGARTEEFTCPMHPFIIKDKVSTCPVCGMELVKKVPGTLAAGKDLQHVAHVALSPAQQVMANLATVTVKVKPFVKEIPATGIIAYNQERQWKITAWVSGRIDRLLVKSDGEAVIKGGAVAELGSYDLTTAEEEYLLAYKALKLFNSSIVPAYVQNSQSTLFEARQRLRQLGFKDEQFEQLQAVGRPTVRVPIKSAVNGVVTEKFVQEGQYVNVGDPLFSVADLTHVWVELELYEDDLSFVRKGQEVALTIKAFPGKQFSGRIVFIYPYLDLKSRTVRVRVTLDNPDLKFKPGMLASAMIRAAGANSIVVPAEAVIDTGNRQVVWVESGAGVFVPRDVTVGARSVDGVQILAGLKAGEKVAAKGGYLIDSEAQLSRGSEAYGAKKPEQKQKDALDMDDMKMPGPRH